MPRSDRRRDGGVGVGVHDRTHARRLAVESPGQEGDEAAVAAAEAAAAAGNEGSILASQEEGGGCNGRGGNDGSGGDEMQDEEEEGVEGEEEDEREKALEEIDHRYVPGTEVLKHTGISNTSA